MQPLDPPQATPARPAWPAPAASAGVATETPPASRRSSSGCGSAMDGSVDDEVGSPGAPDSPTAQHVDGAQATPYSAASDAPVAAAGVEALQRRPSQCASSSR